MFTLYVWKDGKETPLRNFRTVDGAAKYELELDMKAFKAGQTAPLGTDIRHKNGSPVDRYQLCEARAKAYTDAGQPSLSH